MLRELAPALTLLVLAIAGGAAASPGQSGDSTVASANNSFCFRILKELGDEKPDSNVLISPFSISSALTMTLNGAGGDTQNAMAATLGLTGVPLSQINAENRNLLSALAQPSSGIQISSGNALWADARFTFKPDFRNICANDYKATARTLDFSSPTAANTINAWVDTETRGHIPKIVDADALHPGGAVLTNAVYFHGKWTMPFDPSATHPQDFTLDDGSKKSVSMMNGNEWSVPYYETDAFQAVALPYGDNRFSLYVLLPTPGHSVASLTSELTPNVWQTLVDGIHPTMINLGLPKFSANYSATLNTALEAMGMGIAFHEGADFTPMGMPHDSRIDAVIHKATLDVDEQGTTATAATGVVMRALAMPMPRKSFIADHPFVYAIRDSKTGEILFAGIIRDPKS